MDDKELDAIERLAEWGVLSIDTIESLRIELRGERERASQLQQENKRLEAANQVLRDNATWNEEDAAELERLEARASQLTDALTELLWECGAFRERNAALTPAIAKAHRALGAGVGSSTQPAEKATDGK